MGTCLEVFIVPRAEMDLAVGLDRFGAEAGEFQFVYPLRSGPEAFPSAKGASVR
jgi:hypothetical protein